MIRQEEDLDSLTPKELSALNKKLIQEAVKAGKMAPTDDEASGWSKNKDDSLWTKFVGDANDAWQILQGSNVDDDGWVDANGVYHQRTCFVAGTLISTKNGFKKIEDIQIGDMVLSYNEKTGEREFKRVTNTFVRQADVIYTISYEDGSVFETTWNHPFYIEGKGFIQAKDLKPGQLSHTSQSRFLRIANIENESRMETVYNFEVESNHTYYVGESGVLVHNQSLYYNEYMGRISQDMERNFPLLKELREATERKEKIQEQLKTSLKAKEFKHLIGMLKRNGNDAEVLAKIIESNEIYKDDNLRERLTAIFEATEASTVEGLPVRAKGLQIGPPRLGDRGYKEFFKDGSPTQTGHFLTGLRLALQPEVVNENSSAFNGNIIIESPRKQFTKENPKVSNMSDEEIALRMSIGHEKFPDPTGVHGFITGRGLNGGLYRQFAATNEEDIKNFNKAVNILGNDNYNLDYSNAEKYIKKIKVTEQEKKYGIMWNKGNSYADLMLTATAYDLGNKIKSGKIKTRNEAAKYIRTNLKE